MCRLYSSRVAKYAACGPPKPERNAEALRAADRDIGAKFARRFQQRQREDIGRDHDKRAGVMCPLS